MDILKSAQTRYTTKAFEGTRKLPAETLKKLVTLLRCSPSSVNSQPWHFIVVSSDEAKARVATATQGTFAFNEAKVRNAAAVVVLCARTDMSPAHIEGLLQQEARDGRFQTDAAKEGQNKGRNFFINLHRNRFKDLQHWMEKQVYLALGTLLLGAAALEVDACPIEGFDQARIDDEFGLNEKGLTAVVLAGLGYRSNDDFNAVLPKSRLPEEQVFTFL